MMRIILLFLMIVFTSSVWADSSVAGVDHLGLSVSDLKASETFFVAYGGFKVFKRDEKYPASFLNNGSVTITLWRVSDPDSAIKFNRKENIGLHHVAFRVSSFEALDKLYNKLAGAENVRIDFAPEWLGNGPAKHMMVYEPSGNRVEFIHRPNPTSPKSAN